MKEHAKQFLLLRVVLIGALVDTDDPVREATIWISWYLVVGILTFWIVLGRERNATVSKRSDLSAWS